MWRKLTFYIAKALSDIDDIVVPVGKESSLVQIVE